MRSKQSYQSEIGENVSNGLRAIYDKILREPLPDRFCELFDQLKNSEHVAETHSEAVNCVEAPASE